MEPDLLTIRQMCDLFGVTARTLRFYEAKELIAPLRQGQKRLYSRRDCARLKLILRGKRFAFSLEEIRQLLDLYSMENQNLTQMLKTRDLALERLADMEKQRDDLNETIKEFKDYFVLGEQLIAQARRKSGN